MGQLWHSTAESYNQTAEHLGRKEATRCGFDSQGRGLPDSDSDWVERKEGGGEQ